MKKIIFSTLIIAAIVSFFYACNPDDPNNNPQPFDDPRDKFVGTWLCNESSHLNGNSTFSVPISLNPNNSSQVLLANFYQLGASQQVYGIVTSSTVTIPTQTLSSLSIRGSGSIVNNNTRINWTYYVDDGADIDTCTAVYNK